MWFIYLIVYLVIIGSINLMIIIEKMYSKFIKRGRR